MLCFRAHKRALCVTDSHLTIYHRCPFEKYQQTSEDSFTISYIDAFLLLCRNIALQLSTVSISSLKMSQPLSSLSPADAGTPPTCPFALGYLNPPDNVYGHGRFGSVFKALVAPPSPPDSPLSSMASSNAATSTASFSPESPAVGTILAVKKPAEGSVKSAAYMEAQFLSRLSSVQKHDKAREKHIARFFGYVPKDCAIVMEAVSLRLDRYVRDTTPTPMMQREPAIGTLNWLQLALDLVKGLNWLHHKGCIAHGDVKPENILLQPKEHVKSDKDGSTAIFPYKALYTDFGSAFDLRTAPASQSPDSPSTPSFGFTVGTPAFTAPELLSLKRAPELRHPTPESDIFSLAVTLLVPVTGNPIIYRVSSTSALYHMAQNGHLVIDNVRNLHPMPLPVNGVVTKLLKNAVHKDPECRIHGQQWAEDFGTELRNEGMSIQ